ncbi:hypothetical protein ACHAXS_004690, partial [Conticribra weissflogii]
IQYIGFISALDSVIYQQTISCCYWFRTNIQSLIQALDPRFFLPLLHLVRNCRLRKHPHLQILLLLHLQILLLLHLQTLLLLLHLQILLVVHLQRFWQHGPFRLLF